MLTTVFKKSRSWCIHILKKSSARSDRRSLHSALMTDELLYEKIRPDLRGKKKSDISVVVGLSGGVDSSVSAYLLQKEGYKVRGLYMRNWSEAEEGYCSAADDLEQIDRVCTHLRLPYDVVSLEKEYWNLVFQPALLEYQRGVTPNPDVACNREIKFKHFMQYAVQHFGADFVATGHYCRLGLDRETARCQLWRAVDTTKDQTYFLNQVSHEALTRAMFPVGGMHKSEVRALAKSAGLANAERKDSVGVCFIGKRRFDEFLSQYLSSSPGRFVSLSGEDLGEHKGAVYYTVGQRASIPGAKHKHYIVGKDMQTNTVYVASGANHPALFSDELTTRHFNWIGGEPPSELIKHGSMKCHYKVRYRLNYGSCTVALPNPRTPTHVTVRFDIPQRSVTPQQFVALYADQVCLGGGPIDEPGPSYYALKKDVPAVICE